MSKIQQLFYFGNQQYDKHELAVHLVWCANKDESKEPHILPIIAPRGNIYEVCYGADHPKTGKKLRFSLDRYIKAVAKRIVTGYHDDKSKNHPDCWDEAEYDFTAVKLCFGSLAECIDYYGSDVQYFINCKFHSFNDMLALYFIESGTVPVTWEQIEAATKEVEKPISEEISKKSDEKIIEEEPEEISATSSEDDVKDDFDEDIKTDDDDDDDFDSEIKY